MSQDNAESASAHGAMRNQAQRQEERGHIGGWLGQAPRTGRSPLSLHLPPRLPAGAFVLAFILPEP